MKKIIFLFIVATLTIHCFSQTYSIVTENYCRLNFVPKTGVTPGTDNFKALSCDEILARYNVSITGSTITGNRCPSQNQVTALNTCPSVGDAYHGGIVAYVYQLGDPGYVAGECHGIIATVNDLSTGIQWWNGSYILIGTTSQSLGEGGNNTTEIIAAQGGGSYAASICADLTDSEGGYSDWVLPSFDEMSLMYVNRYLIGNFYLTNDPNSDIGYYWTSTEENQTGAWRILFNQGYMVYGSISKGNSGTRVRPIRYF